MILTFQVFAMAHSIRAYAEGSARVLASACRVTVPLLQMVFLALSFPEKSAGLLAAVRALLAFCLPPTRAVSFVLTSPHRTFAGGSGLPRGFNPRQVPNPRMERYTDPKALHDRRRSEPEWGTLSNAIVRHPPPARRPVALPHIAVLTVS